jgi:capsular exopolysaccharide synthesis family protein
MGRIDDALTRASAGRETAAPSSMQQRHFVSAWEEEQATAPQKSTAVARVLPEVTPNPELFDPILVPNPRGTALAALAATWGERLTAASSCSAAVVEQYRRLAAVLHKAQAAGNIKVVMVTSATPGDGKTLTAINLALALSDSYKRRVLLVDADLRRPSIGTAAGLNGAGGLSEALKAAHEEKLAVVPITPMLTLLPGGAPDPDPMSSLTSSRMRRILEEAVTRFDWVIVDAPPVGPIADAHLLAEMVDTSVLVVRAAQTHFADAQKALETLGRDRVLGVVFNAVDHEVSGNYASHYQESL